MFHYNFNQNQSNLFIMSKPLIPAQRREKIQEYLTIHQIARTADLCELLDTSEATVRRDLEWLEKKGVLERTHGGATLNQRMILEQEYQQRAQHHPDEKRRIGELAASLIEEGDIVFINSGTTATQVLQHIRSNSNIMVITNNVSAVMELGEPGFHYHLTGGEFQPRSTQGRTAGSDAPRNHPKAQEKGVAYTRRRATFRS